MEGLNTLSTFGTHPKDFDPERRAVSKYIEKHGIQIPGRTREGEEMVGRTGNIVLGSQPAPMKIGVLGSQPAPMKIGVLSSRPAPMKIGVLSFSASRLVCNFRHL